MPNLPNRRIQPLCPIRSDAKCMGAPCAWSRRTVQEDGVWVFTCGIPRIGDLPVIDRRPIDADPVERA